MKNLGLVLVSSAKGATDAASPDERMFSVSRASILGLVASYRDLCGRVREMMGASRLSNVAVLGINDEWSLSSAFGKLRPMSLKG